MFYELNNANIVTVTHFRGYIPYLELFGNQIKLLGTEFPKVCDAAETCDALTHALTDSDKSKFVFFELK